MSTDEALNSADLASLRTWAGDLLPSLPPPPEEAAVLLVPLPPDAELLEGEALPAELDDPADPDEPHAPKPPTIRIDKL
ncbi:hypothetical protein [Allobranchiibius sp. GilTou73]|uniref:hypothetical protein n=1 Tax=Allobranchiibius sp. GilTou73 TaxID=2904523 RepID=UPI001F18D26B|nr:hypothetical protein [Allobranchiibius sp. GilTou73]UIJ36000.1 hypothetical protein LVQ62_06390 [Allobranchiibius sp. GilTou73]